MVVTTNFVGLHLLRWNLLLTNYHESEWLANFQAFDLLQDSQPSFGEPKNEQSFGSITNLLFRNESTRKLATYLLGTSGYLEWCNCTLIAIYFMESRMKSPFNDASNKCLKPVLIWEKGEFNWRFATLNKSLPKDNKNSIFQIPTVWK